MATTDATHSIGRHEEGEQRRPRDSRHIVRKNKRGLCVRLRHNAPSSSRCGGLLAAPRARRGSQPPGERAECAAPEQSSNASRHGIEVPVGCRQAGSGRAAKHAPARRACCSRPTAGGSGDRAHEPTARRRAAHRSCASDTRLSRRQQDVSRAVRLRAAGVGGRKPSGRAATAQRVSLSARARSLRSRQCPEARSRRPGARAASTPRGWHTRPPTSVE